MHTKKLLLISLLAGSMASDVLAGTWSSYAVGDVMLCFRKSGVANDLVVDLGPISTFTNASVNQRISITQYAGNQLALVGTNSIDWSASAYFDGSASPSAIRDTLFSTQPRPSLNTESSPIAAASKSAQTYVVDYMDEVPLGAKYELAYNAVNTATAVIEPDNGNIYTEGNGSSYSGALIESSDLDANWNDTFTAYPENTTALNFTTAGTVQRSDFYWIPPTTSGYSVAYLGYFELNTNGAMTYVAYPTAPTVTTLAASGTTSANSQLNATVNPINANAAATLYFRYGLTTSYGSASDTNIIGTTAGNYGVPISGLLGGTTYHFQAVAYNSYGTNYGSDLTFTTSAGSVVAPVITGIVRTNGISKVSFTTGSSGTYTLCGTNTAGLAASRTNWPAISSVAGNGSVNTLTDTTAAVNKFYYISAQ